MTCNLFLSWAVLLATFGLLLAHPITESAELLYSGPMSVEEGGAGSPDELSLSDLRAPGLGYASLLSGELSRDGLTAAGLLPREALRAVLLEKQSRLGPFSRLLGSRRQFRKRGAGADCFWKYCV